ncbi:hypothetical protein J7K97_03150 [Candidatus Aerophobetes bacterium]|nr:hypothetical protein [Candidatus Aerophobetes bacterium]
MDSKRGGDDSIERYLLRSIQEELGKKWKEREDKKGISKDPHLKIELSKLPSHWIQAIYRQLGYIEETDKKEQIHCITHILSNKKFLKKVLVELSRSSLFIIKYLLSRGGWGTFQTLSRQANTDESDDGWWWVDDPPSSPLGQLRVRGLVFVGRAPVKNRLYKIAVIPRELRRVLSEILPEVYRLKDAREKRTGQRKYFSPLDEENYLDLIEEIKNYFKKYVDDSLMLKETQVIKFIKSLKQKGVPFEEIDQAWEDIQCFIDFIQYFSFGKSSLEDFKTWDFSHLVLKFIPQEYGETTLTYEEVRRILHNIAELYKNMKQRGEIVSDTEIQKAISHIIREDGKINRIPTPPAKGPEILLKVSVPGSKKYIYFTNNDLWSTIVLHLQYNEDWESMLSDLEEKNTYENKIIDARQKKENLLKLRGKMKECKATPYNLLCYLKPDRREIEKATKWFYKKKFIQG